MSGLIFSLTTGDWVAAAVCALVGAMLAAPVIWLCWSFVQMDDDAVVRAIEDVERFVELTDAARRELVGVPGRLLLDSRGLEAAGDAIDRFVARKALAREALGRQPLSSAVTRGPAAKRCREVVEAV